MSINVAISGMGRIGRLLVRKLFDTKLDEIQLKAINATYPVDQIAHLLKYDTVHGKWNADVQFNEHQLIINDHIIEIVMERNPEKLPWKKLGIGIVIDATGKFNDREGSQKHLQAGAKKVIISAPGENMDLTVVMGVNEDQYDSEKHHLLSTASCTTNCLSPILKIVDDAFEIQQGWMTTVHAFTNDQKHLDNPHKDLRRARACTQSIIPTSSGVGKALTDVIPHLAPIIQGISLRVPTQDVSLVDLTLQINRNVSTEDVIEVFQKAIEESFENYVSICDEPLVSSDFVGNDKSAVIDQLSLMVSGNQLKILAWYDNEWAYANRVIDFTQYVTLKNNERMWEECNAATV